MELGIIVAPGLKGEKKNRLGLGKWKTSPNFNSASLMP